MINILPPVLKEQSKYSKYNVVVLHYLIGLMMIALLVGGTLFLSHWYANEQIAEYETILESTLEETERFSELEESVATLNTKFETIDALMKQRPPFSVLLQELSDVLPRGSFINGISLREQVDQPVQLNISTTSNNQAIIIRNALIQSPLIDSADIQSISPSSDGERVNVRIVIAFNTENIE